jgi:hypothetical protein
MLLGLGLGFGHNVAAAGGGGGGAAAALWNGAISNAHYTLSSGNTVATDDNAGGGDILVKSDNSHSGTGDWWIDIKNSGGSGAVVIGLANATASTTAYCGSDANSIGAWSATGGVLGGTGSTFSGGSYAPNDVVRVRLKNGKVYWALQVGGAGAFTYMTGTDPATETGGVDVSTKGALFAACSTTSGGSMVFTIIDGTHW